MSRLWHIREALARNASVFAPPGSCTWCGGSGTELDQIDEDRPPMAVPCHHCRVYCTACGRDVPKKGHVCNEVVARDLR